MGSLQKVDYTGMPPAPASTTTNVQHGNVVDKPSTSATQTNPAGKPSLSKPKVQTENRFYADDSQYYGDLSDDVPTQITQGSDTLGAAEKHQQQQHVPEGNPPRAEKTRNVAAEVAQRRAYAVEQRSARDSARRLVKLEEENSQVDLAEEFSKDFV